jgi:potassium efflux system protein
MLLAGLCEAPSMERCQLGLGRLWFIVHMCLLATCCFLILRPHSPLYRHLLATNTAVGFTRLRWGWLLLGVGAPLTLVILAALGYYHTADRLASRLLASLYVLLGLILCSGVLLRWILLVRRRLAMMVTGEMAGREPPARAQPATPGEGLDLATVSEQMQRLVVGTLTIAAAVALWLIWRDVLPALRPAANVFLLNFTLAQLVTVVILVMVTILLARSAPGLLQLLIYSRVPVAPGTRYAIQALVTYCIVLVGLIVISNQLGLRWSNIQWLVAALGVGLGFGLQEIVANFICGLIILFEQPIRVGDVVSIDGVTGVVSKIRFRSTIVVNWDRQEFIIPNKDLITGWVINWTVTDQTNRIVVKVAVAYGSDVARVRHVLLQIAEQHPLICREPTPSVTLEEFGDSALIFVLRCFLPSLEHRLQVIHELHAAIYDRFRQEGIEIAFPQLDVHIVEGPDTHRTAP